MTPDTSIWSFIINAGFIVQFVLIILFCASILSWTIIFQRYSLFKRRMQSAKNFITQFWSGKDLNQLSQDIEKTNDADGLATIFQAGFKEFMQRQNQSSNKDAILEGTERAMRIANAREMDKLENHISLLATIGSTSPYIGLFGTVWGIMTSFRALGGVSQATIAMVAPGISEALIATAIGLFAAIPAVIAYNRFSNHLERLSNHYATFQEEFINLLHRKIGH